jgi:cysteine desulfurase/selenocysteine lyase
VDLTRRKFIGSVSAAAAVGGLKPGAVAALQQDPLDVRKDFPVVEQGIYLNSAYITPSPLQAVRTAQDFAERKARDPVSLGSMLGETNAMRGKFARLVGATEEEIGVLFATSDGENIVTRALDFRPGDNVVVDDLHYDTTYILYQHLRETRGIEVRTVRNQGGAASAEAFAEQVDDRTKLVSVSWISHVNGYRHDLAALARLAHDHGAYLYADAIQGVGMLDLDVRDTGIDFFTAGTYKWLLGGFGVAPFYVKAELLDTVSVDRFGSLQSAEDLGGHRFRLHEDAKKYGYATMSFGAVFQLSAALDYLLRVGVQNVERHTVALANRLNEGLRAQGHDVLTPRGNRSAIVTFEHGHDLDMVHQSLDEASITLTVRDGGAQLRAGIALFNTDEEIDRLLEVTASWT